MKYGMVTDIHIGFNFKNQIFFLEKQLSALHGVFRHFIAQRVDEIVLLGDTFDSRNSTNNECLLRFFKFIRFWSKSFKFKIIVGNHDLYYKKSMELHMTEILGTIPGVQIIDEITEIGNCLFVPWLVNDQVKQDFINKTDTTDADYCFGHFEIKDFAYNDHRICENGLIPEIFKNFKHTFTGHFHGRQSIKVNKDSEITYLGSIVHKDRNDKNNPASYGIIDTELNELKMFDAFDFPPDERPIRFLNIKCEGDLEAKEFLKKTYGFDVKDCVVDFIHKDITDKQCVKIQQKIYDFQPFSLDVISEDDDLGLGETEIENYHEVEMDEMLLDFFKDLDHLEEDEKDKVISNIKKHIDLVRNGE